MFCFYVYFFFLRKMLAPSPLRVIKRINSGPVCGSRIDLITPVFSLPERSFAVILNVYSLPPSNFVSYLVAFGQRDVPAL